MISCSRYQQPYRSTREAIENVRLLSPSGERVSLAQLTKVATTDGAEEIYRESQQRYIAAKYSVRGRDLGSTVEEAIDKGEQAGISPAGVSHRLGRRVREPEAFAEATVAGASDHNSSDLCDPLHDVQIRQVGRFDHGERRDGPHWGTTRAIHYAHKLQRLFRRWFPCSLWRLRADRSHHARVHQPASCTRPLD